MKQDILAISLAWTGSGVAYTADYVMFGRT